MKALNYHEQEIVGAFITFTIMVLVTVVPWIVFAEPESEPEEPQRLHLALPQPHLEAPDVSTAFEVKAQREATKAVLDEVQGIKTKIDTIELPVVTMKLTNLGKYYITGYTSIECGGSTMTASGATCHKASYENRITQPTTCAIDPALHDFGDLFYIEAFDTVYVAEDTGSAVKGKHLDLYFWDDEYGYALSITGYYTVYAVEYIEGTYQPGAYDIRKQVTDKVIGWKIKGT